MELQGRIHLYLGRRDAFTVRHSNWEDGMNKAQGCKSWGEYWEKEKETGNRREIKTHLAMLWGSKESCSPNLEVLRVNSFWTWVPVKMSLPRAAMLIKQYCLPILHKPLQGVSVLGSAYLKGHCGVMLPACHSFCMSPSQDWFMTQQGTQTIYLCVGQAIGWGLVGAVPYLLDSTLTCNPQLWSCVSLLALRYFFLYLINWLWSLVVCATRQTQTILEPVACTSHYLPELKDHLCLKMNCWKNESMYLL